MTTSPAVPLQTPVYLWPRRSVVGWDGEQPISAEHWPAVELDTVLEREHATDAHFVPYVVVGADGNPWRRAPRINKAALPALAAMGAELRYTTLIFDIDDPVQHKAHRPARPEWLASQLDALCELPRGLFRTLGHYVTRGGFRLLWRLPRWLTAAEYHDMRRAVQAALAETLSPADDFGDFGRCYRAPDVIRSDKQPDGTWARSHQIGRGDFSHLGPLTWTPPAAPVSPFANLGATRALDAKRELPEQIAEMRNATLLSLAGRLRDTGSFSEAEILATVRATNQARCAPPLDDAEVQGICAKYAGQAPRRSAPPAISANLAAALAAPPTAPPPATIADMPESPGAAPEQVLDAVRARARTLPADARRDPGAAFDPTALEIAVVLRAQDPASFARLRAELRGAVSIPDWLRAVRDAAREIARRKLVEEASQARFVLGSEVEIADALCKDLEGEGEPLVFDRGVFWHFDPLAGLWKQRHDDELQRHVTGYDGAQMVGGTDAAGNPKLVPLRVSQRLTADVRKLASTLRTQHEFFDRAPRGVAFANGFLEVEHDGKVRSSPLVADHRATWALPLAYDPHATAPRFGQYLAEVFAPDADADGKERLLAQFFGAALFGLAPRFKRALLLHGPSADNGKSVLLETISALYPDAARTSISPQDMGDNAMGALLAGKRINVVAEMPDGDVMRGEAFKAVIDGSPITRAQKYEKPITFCCEAAHVFAANRLPGSSDKTDGFFTRWLVVSFNRKFARHEMEFGLAKRLIADELPGIAAWCVRGAVDLLMAGDYTLPDSSRAEIDQWRHRVDPLALFLAECCVRSPGTWTASSELFAAYTAWMAAGNYRHPLTLGAFGLRMHEIGIEYRRSNGSRYAVQLLPRPSWGQGADLH